MTRRSLRFRLLLAAAVSISLALLVAGLGLSALFEHHVERRVEAQLDDTLGQILAHIGIAPDGRIHFDLALADPRFRAPLSGLYWQIQDDERRTLLRSRSLWDTVLPLPEDALPDGILHRHELTGPGGQTLLVVERRVVFHPESEGRRLRVAVALDRAELTAARRGFANDMLPYLVLLGVMLLAAAWVQVRIGLAPLDAVRLGLKSIRSGTARRLPADYPDEVDPLAAEVNALLDARDGAIERARAWTADLAHGLKTPLVVLSADAERLRAAGQPDLADDLDSLAQTMRQRVDRELIRARIRARNGSNQASGIDPAADLPTVLDRVVRTLQRTPKGGAPGLGSGWPRGPVRGDVAGGPHGTARHDSGERRQLGGEPGSGAGEYRPRRCWCRWRTTAPGSRTRPWRPWRSGACGSTSAPRGPAWAWPSPRMSAMPMVPSWSSGVGRARAWGGCWSPCVCLGPRPVGNRPGGLRGLPGGSVLP